MAMRAITAALDTAATIEARPESYRYFSVHQIKTKTAPACLLGHIRFRMGLVPLGMDYGLDRTAKALGCDGAGQFYDRLDRLQQQGRKRLKEGAGELRWQDSAPIAAKYLRRYVAKWM